MVSCCFSSSTPLWLICHLPASHLCLSSHSGHCRTWRTWTRSSRSEPSLTRRCTWDERRLGRESSPSRQRDPVVSWETPRRRRSAQPGINRHSKWRGCVGVVRILHFLFDKYCTRVQVLCRPSFYWSWRQKYNICVEGSDIVTKKRCTEVDVAGHWCSTSPFPQHAFNYGVNVE